MINSLSQCNLKKIGDIVHMEINDGGAAETEFASEDEDNINESQHPESEAS